MLDELEVLAGCGGACQQNKKMLMLGFEPKTFALSAQRSTKLSYTSLLSALLRCAYLSTRSPRLGPGPSSATSGGRRADGGLHLTAHAWLRLLPHTFCPAAAPLLVVHWRRGRSTTSGRGPTAGACARAAAGVDASVGRYEGRRRRDLHSGVAAPAPAAGTHTTAGSREHALPAKPAVWRGGARRRHTARDRGISAGGRCGTGGPRKSERGHAARARGRMDGGRRSDSGARRALHQAGPACATDPR